VMIFYGLTIYLDRKLSNYWSVVFLRIHLHLIPRLRLCGRISLILVSFLRGVHRGNFTFTLIGNKYCILFTYFSDTKFTIRNTIKK
jgi:hypothetical protein